MRNHRLLVVTFFLSALLHLLLLEKWLPGGSLDEHANAPPPLEIALRVPAEAGNTATTTESRLTAARTAEAAGVVDIPSQPPPAATVTVTANPAPPPEPTRPDNRPTSVAQTAPPTPALPQEALPDRASDTNPLATAPQTQSLPSAPTPTRSLPPTIHAKLAAQLDELLADPERALATKHRVAVDADWEFTVSVTERTPSTPVQTDQLTVHLDTQTGGQALSTSLQMNKLAFSYFAQFVDRWDDDVWLAHDEVIGRFHSNSRIRVDTDPKVRPSFHGPVTVAGRVTGGRGLLDPSIFRAGLTTHVRPIPMPTISRELQDLGSGTLPPDHRLLTFSTNTAIEFLGNAGVRWESDQGHTDQEPHWPILFLVAQKGVTLSVRGTVAGQVLVYSPHTVLISGSLVYAQPPDQNPASADLLGLVSEGAVMVAPPAVTGPGDLIVHAAIYAQRRFGIQQFRARQHATFTILGSLTAGSLSATEPRYRTRILHDQRLTAQRPPLFPQTAEWTAEPLPREWRIEEAAAQVDPTALQ